LLRRLNAVFTISSYFSCIMGVSVLLLPL
jgi:hypothetical protein